MVECSQCGREMKTAESCTINGIILDGKVYARNTSYFDDLKRCHDCGIINMNGNVHHFGCDIERCPKCGNQLISCGCHKDKLVKLDIKVRSEIKIGV